MKILTKEYTNKSGKLNEYYYLRFSHNGKDIWRSLGKKGLITKAYAEKIALKIRRDFELEKHGIKSIKSPKMKDFAIEYLTYQKKVKKIRSWDRTDTILKTLIKYFTNKMLNEITVKDIDNFKKSRIENSIKPSTVNRELAVLRHLFFMAVKWNKFIGKNPVSESGLFHVENQKERILTFEEERKLLNNSPDYLKAIIKCALNTAMRKNEIITLSWDNVDLEYNLLTIEVDNNKSKKTKKIPINSTLRQLLLELKLKSGGNKYVFLNSYRKPYIRHDSLNRAFYLALKKADIDGLRFHDLRHTAATRMIENGVDIVTVSKILGHSDIKTTMRYAHPENTLFEAVESLVNTI